ncbi:Cadherin-18 isoform X1 [Aix galericulata]|nr:Cadherin-18 isoform X1 [Aix galericulata]
MVSIRHGALSRNTVHTQTDYPFKNTAVQVTGCGECLSLLLPSAGGRETADVRCEQVDDLVRMVAELKEEVERLRDIRECEREIDWWSNSLQGLKERYRAETPQMGVDPLPCRRRAEGGDLGVEEEWRQIPARHCRQCPSLLAPPSQVPLCKRFETLELERLVAEEKVESLPRSMPRAPKASCCHNPVINTYKDTLISSQAIVVLFITLRRSKKEPLIISEEDVRENVVTYDDEGGGEEDTEAFDITALRNPSAAEELKYRRDVRPEVKPAPRHHPSSSLDSVDVQEFIKQRLAEADLDPSVPPYDSLQTYAYEGHRSEAGSISSLDSVTTHSDQDYNYLGKFKIVSKLAANVECFLENIKFYFFRKAGYIFSTTEKLRSFCKGNETRTCAQYRVCPTVCPMKDTNELDSGFCQHCSNRTTDGVTRISSGRTAPGPHLEQGQGGTVEWQRLKD